MNDIKDLETQGFVVIKNFITKHDVDKYKTLFNKISIDKNRKIILANFNHDLNRQIDLVLKQVKEETDIVVDIVMKNPAFFDNSVFDIDWHQDHEPYYLTQDSYNSLNFWIPIVKPDPKTSGIFIVPHSSLPEDLKKLIIGTGAKTFIRENDKTIISDNSTGNKYEVDFDLDKHCIVPEVEAGDLVLMRVDVIHKSQYPTERRIAMSVRCYNSNTKIVRDKFFSGCDFKKSRMQKDRLMYKPLIDAFDKTADDFILIGNKLK